MVNFQQRIARRVEALAARVSKTITYRRFTRGSGPSPQHSYQDSDFKARISGFTANQVDGVHVRGTDLRVTVPGRLLQQPSLQDKLVIDGREMIIVSFQPQYIADQVGLWIIQARA